MASAQFDACTAPSKLPMPLCLAVLVEFETSGSCRCHASELLVYALEVTSIRPEAKLDGATTSPCSHSCMPFVGALSKRTRPHQPAINLYLGH
eukprot:5461974-Amphidinium_carterae.1